MRTCKFLKDPKLHSPYELVQFCQSLKNLLVLIYSKLHSKSCDYLYKLITYQNICILFLMQNNDVTIFSTFRFPLQATEMPLRLTYTPVPYAGCVEVEYAKVWGDIGSFGWDQADSRVVCKELGYRDVLAVFWGCRAILKKSYSVVTWVDNVRCRGNERSLNNCSREFQTYRSSLGFDAGVVCKRETEPG